MRLIKLDQLTGNEILAKAVLTEDYQELLAEGTQIKLAYLPKLVDMGITEVFKEGKANLTNICEDSSVYVEDAVHKANIEFNQDGIKASAATMIVSQ